MLVSVERNVDFGLILVKYGLERTLFRLSRSRHRDDFILKGTLLFELWTEQRYRPTKDADLLARGDNAPTRFANIFRELCVLEVDEHLYQGCTGTSAKSEQQACSAFAANRNMKGSKCSLMFSPAEAKCPRVNKMWRRRVGVEPTIRSAKGRIGGFEGRDSHRTIFASS
jgi:Nucleotidyl transferase AbiEii toxin, Type IV TA system